MLRDVKFRSDVLSKFTSATRMLKTGWFEKGELNARSGRYVLVLLDHLIST